MASSLSGLGKTKFLKNAHYFTSGESRSLSEISDRREGVLV